MILLYQLWTFGECVCLKIELNKIHNSSTVLPPQKVICSFERKSGFDFFDLSVNFFRWYWNFWICCFKIMIKVEIKSAVMMFKRFIEFCWLLVFFCRTWVVIFSSHYSHMSKMLIAVLLWNTSVQRNLEDDCFIFFYAVFRTIPGMLFSATLSSHPILTVANGLKFVNEVFENCARRYCTLNKTQREVAKKLFRITLNRNVNTVQNFIFETCILVYFFVHIFEVRTFCFWTTMTKRSNALINCTTLLISNDVIHRKPI